MIPEDEVRALGLAPLLDGAQEVLGRPLAESEISSFGLYLALLLRWQSVQRLVGRSDPLWIAKELFLDSLLFLHVLPPDARRVLDIGSGAGVPGVPMRIVRADLAMTLIESRRRRASFLSTVVRELGLEGTRVINARAETLVPELGASADAAVMRCAGSASDLIPSIAGLVRPGGIVVASVPLSVGTDRTWKGEWVDIPSPMRRLRRFAVARL
jgi:16S rRNA (guanine527-N7)-methyltransferase